MGYRKMWHLVLLLGSGFLYEGCDANNVTANSREEKSFGILNIVKFPNDMCIGTTDLNGTCYTESECRTKNGVSSGSCASSFGVCCVFSLACGGDSAENTTYAIITSTTSTETNPCTYTFCRAADSICKLRIDYEVMSIAKQNPGFSGAAAVTNGPPATAVQDITRIGLCDSDVLTVTNPGGTAPPVICGVNTGQHMFVPASDSCNQIKIFMKPGDTTTRSWRIKVTQHKCNSPSAPQQSCLQWHTGLTGSFFSFGWDTSVATVTDTSHTHLSDQNYDICFRRERGYCGLCFYPNAARSFGVSAGEGTTISVSVIDANCGDTIARADFIELDNMHKGDTTQAVGQGTVGRQRFCGNVWSTGTAAAAYIAGATATGCTFSAPFRWGVRFDAIEFGIAAIGAHGTSEVFNQAGAPDGYGYTGFYMDFFQKACV